MHLRHNGKTYEIGAIPAALDATAFLLPDGTLLGIEWHECMPPVPKVIHVLPASLLRHEIPGAVLVATEVTQEKP